MGLPPSEVSIGVVLSAGLPLGIIDELEDVVGEVFLELLAEFDLDFLPCLLGIVSDIGRVLR